MEKKAVISIVNPETGEHRRIGTWNGVVSWMPKPEADYEVLRPMSLTLRAYGCYNGVLTSIKVAQDFSKYPGGRLKTDGPASGERFRDDFLLPALKASDMVVVYLDGVAGYPHSFLEEAFGGLVRVHGLTRDKLEELYLDTDKEYLKNTIKQFIEDALCRL